MVERFFLAKPVETFTFNCQIKSSEIQTFDWLNFFVSLISFDCVWQSNSIVRLNSIKFDCVRLLNVRFDALGILAQGNIDDHTFAGVIDWSLVTSGGNSGRLDCNH